MLSVPVQAFFKQDLGESVNARLHCFAQLGALSQPHAGEVHALNADLLENYRSSVGFGIGMSIGTGTALCADVVFVSSSSLRRALTRSTCAHSATRIQLLGAVACHGIRSRSTVSARRANELYLTVGLSSMLLLFLLEVPVAATSVAAVPLSRLRATRIASNGSAGR